MRLKSLDYSEHEGTPEAWTMRGLTLANVNLLVGKNASGKSWILNVIFNLARAITGSRSLVNGHFRMAFDDRDSALDYELEVKDQKVFREIFRVAGETRLSRGPGGRGTIFAVQENRTIEFQPPEAQLAVCARRDTLQHPYFEPLHQWAGSLYHYAFGTPLGKEVPAFSIKTNGQDAALDPKDSSQVVGIFRKGKQVFGSLFTDAVTADFRAVGYSIEDVGIESPHNVKIVVGPAPGELVALYVKESDLLGRTNQFTMSQGMFRALSVVVQVNYAVLADTPSCILIDDIGEGLDFDRSCNLIDVLMTKVKSSSVQLLMATNDRFVMNRVPLENWSVIDRKGNHVAIRNYGNSKAIFDRFKFTGLNNFDFLAFDYLHAGAADE